MSANIVLEFKGDEGSPSLSVRCARAGKRLKKLKDQTGFNKQCSYAFTGFSPDKFRVYTEHSFQQSIDEDTSRYTCQSPVFFEQTDCLVIVEFPEDTREARLFSPIAALCEKAENGWDGKRLQLPLNFGNDLGDFELCFEWKLAEEDQWRTCSFRAQVFSTKLDTGSHFKAMMNEVGERFHWLRLDLLRQTFWGWSHDSEAEVTQQTWLAIFQEVRQEMGWALKQLTQRHRKRLTGKEYWLRADRIKKLPPRLEEKVHRILQDRPDAKLRVERQFLDVDTPENRYIKHLLMQCIRQLGELGLTLQDNDRVSGVFKERLSEWEADWTRLRHQPFWNAIGPFHGLRGEPLVLSQDPLYACVRRNWRWLQEGLALLNQDLKGGIQNAAQLYEIWCLVQLDKYLSTHPDWSEKKENLIPFERSENEWNPEERHSGTIKLNFTNKQNSQINLDLLFQPTAGRKPNRNYWDGMMALPESQCPDLVLRLHRGDLPNQPVYTWIFDAKYRIDTDKEGDHKGAPPDAIASMHRYRDAILWAADTKGEGRLTRESLGAFVLYPGKELNNKKQFQAKSIDKVNIGTFSLRPPKEKQGKEEHAIKEKTALGQKLGELIAIGTEGPGKSWEVQELDYFDPIPDVRKPHVHGTVLVGYIREEALQTCRDDGIFYFHAVYNETTAVPTDPRVFDADFFVPYLNFGPVGWYGKIESCKLITKEQLKTDLGVEVLGAHDGEAQPSHYYLVTLAQTWTDSLPTKHNLWKDLITGTEKNLGLKSGSPFTCTWASLWKGSAVL